MFAQSKGRDDPNIKVSSPVCLVSAMAIFLSLNVANCEVNIDVNVSDKILLSFSEVYVTYYFQNESISSGYPNTEKQMKAPGRRQSAFIVSRCLDTTMKHEARVLEITSPDHS